MDTELKAKWISALRSGKYEQGHGCLRSNGKFCCLGVLADLAGFEFEDHPLANNIVVDGKNMLYRPIEELIGTTDLYQLWKRNDGAAGEKQHSFPEIADYIEANL